ncbi:MAG: hypothetical protein WD316_05550 [Phycisphaeraceae bacterium]
MTIHAGRANLTDAMKTLHARWQRAQGAWRDNVSGRFARANLQPLEADARTALSAMTEMDAILRRIRRDCEK